jgi:hypothetical protein
MAGRQMLPIFTVSGQDAGAVDDKNVIDAIAH